MKRKAWAVMWVAYLAGVAIALNQFKVPPVMQVLLDSLQVSMATGGWLMSVFSVAGVMFALPAAFLLGRVGPKASGLVALGCTIVGSVIGALAQGAGVLLVGRIIEGIGLALIAVVAPAVISMWFEPQERGLPMGIWSSWVPVATFVMYNIADAIQKSFGWQGIWWLGTAVALVAFVAYAAVVDVPDKGAAGEEKQKGAPVSMGEGLLSLNTWLLALAFCGFNFALIGYSTWAPSYLSEFPGVGTAAANFYASLPSLVLIPGGIFAGWVLDRTRNRKAVLTIALAAVTVVLIWCFKLDTFIVVPYMIGIGLISSFVPSSTFTLAPETAPRPELAGVALGVVSIGQNFGMLVGPPVIAKAAAGGAWVMGTYPVVIGCAVAIVAALLMRIRAGAETRNRG